jgi:large subunit ribosomal protein L9
MKIILLDDVPKLGRRGEVRDVSDGYARNYLRNIETIKAAQEGRAVRMRSEAETQAQLIEGLTYAQSRSASDEGRLFGSVGKADIAGFLAQNGLTVERRRIMLDEPIKSIGEYTVPVRLHGDVTATLKVTVARE